MLPNSLKFNKMFIMLPLMLAVRKIDAENATVVYWLRVAYALVQGTCFAIVAYTYFQATALANSASPKLKQTLVYVPPPPVPFADPNAKKKYTETAYISHVQSQALSLCGSTLFSIVVTVVLHYYKGMVSGVAIQTIMGPMNLIENALVRALLLGNGIQLENRIFGEKIASEITPDDEVVDDKGNPVTLARLPPTGESKDANNNNSDASFEAILLDTWDLGVRADLARLLANIHKKNCNYQTTEDHWTPLMILAGLPVPGCQVAIEKVKQLGGNPALTDVEGWNASHWAAFHGNVEAALELGLDTSLLIVKDKEGNTPIDIARKEGNEDVAKIFEEALGESKKTK